MAYSVNESDRRPIAARRAKWAHAVTRWLAGRRVSPNAISVAGMVLAIVGGASLAATPLVPVWGVRWLLIAGAMMAFLRLLANLFDGMVAVAQGIASPVGELYNDVPDRVSDAALLIGAGYAVTGSPTAGWAAAVTAIFVAYVRACGKAGGGPSVFVGPMAKPHRMWLLIAACLFAAVTPTAWWAVRGVGALAIALWIVVAGGIVTVVRRLLIIALALREHHP